MWVHIVGVVTSRTGWHPCATFNSKVGVCTKELCVLDQTVFNADVNSTVACYILRVNRNSNVPSKQVIQLAADGGIQLSYSSNIRLSPKGQGFINRDTVEERSRCLRSRSGSSCSSLLSNCIAVCQNYYGYSSEVSKESCHYISPYIS